MVKKGDFLGARWACWGARAYRQPTALYVGLGVSHSEHRNPTIASTAVDDMWLTISV